MIRLYLGSTTGQNISAGDMLLIVIPGLVVKAHSLFDTKHRQLFMKGFQTQKQKWSIYSYSFATSLETERYVIARILPST